MGCDTKGFVVTKNKDVQEIGKRVVSVIRTIQTHDEKSFVKNTNVFVKPEYDPKWNYFTFDFKDGSDKRFLFVHMGCDGDFRECYKIGDGGIIFSLGAWGNSVELIKKMLDDFQDMGECYIMENDCVGDAVPYKN